MPTRKNRAFSLIEILVAMALLAVAFGAIGVNIPRAIREQRFESQTEALLSKIELAEELMLDTENDIELVIEQQTQGVRCLFYCTRMSPEFLRKLNRETSFPDIKSVTFNGSSSNPCRLPFLISKGSGPRGLLTLKGKSEKHCLLKGVPGATEKSKVSKKVYDQTPPYPTEALPTT